MAGDSRLRPFSCHGIEAGLGALANAGRNTSPLKPTDNIDLSLLKRFNFTERIRFAMN